MFDLNEMQTGGTQIFNNGEAGVVKNVTISVEKKKADEPDTYPDFKLIVKDKAGAEVNQGFYYFKNNDSYDAAKNERNEQFLVSRVLGVARAAVADEEGFTFPEVKDSKDALNKLFKIIKEHGKDKKFNVYVTYGNTTRPSKYLGLRFFDFIEAATEDSKLFPKNGELLQRIQEDAPSSSTSTVDTSDDFDEDWD